MPQSTLLKLYNEAEHDSTLDEDDLVEYFGKPPYAFAGEGTYKTTKSAIKSIAGSPSREFGKSSLTQDQRWKIYFKLPKWMQQMIPKIQVGFWIDEEGREYKMEEKYSKTEERWSMRLPIVRNRKRKRVEFTEQTEILQLQRGLGKITREVVAVEVLRAATATIIMHVIQKQTIKN